MIARKSWLIRLSVLLNIIVVLYVATHIASSKTGGADGEGILTREPSAAALESEAEFDYVARAQSTKLSSPANSASRSTLSDEIPIPVDPSKANKVLSSTTRTTDERSNVLQEATTDSKKSGNTAYRTEDSASLPIPLVDILKCVDIKRRQSYEQRGDYWILYNYVMSDKSFRCWESITYTTHGDFTFVDNLTPLVERWRGPVSLAMFAPGTDFNLTLQSIQWIRSCGSPLVKELVTFHVYFNAKNIPPAVPRPQDALKGVIANCSVPPPWTGQTTFKQKNNLMYPVNVGRNVARLKSQTHFVLASDVELYPSPGVIPQFLDMIQRQEEPLLHNKPRVFPLSIFEIEEKASPPVEKKELVAMLHNGSAIPFHKKVCSGCHRVPKSDEWIKANITDGLHVFHIGKRLGNFVHWEPIYIGTNDEPLYDERLSWEGKSDKMTQGYTLCVLDYEFQILDNAFLVHRPGIKSLKQDKKRNVITSRQSSFIKKVIWPELRILYGTRKGCIV